MVLLGALILKKKSKFLDWYAFYSPSIYEECVCVCVWVCMCMYLMLPEHLTYQVDITYNSSIFTRDFITKLPFEENREY